MASGVLAISSSTANDHVSSVVPGELGFVKVAAGENFTCVLTTEETVKCFGDNGYGQIGNGRGGYGVTELSPSLVRTAPNETLSGIVDLKAGSAHMVALKKDGTVWTWGWNGGGFASVDSSALGNGVGPNKMFATQVGGLAGATQIGAGHHTGFAFVPSDDLFGWGRNNRGTLGVPGFGGVFRDSIPLYKVSSNQIASGYDVTCSISDLSLQAECWGDNRWGAVGDTRSLGAGVVGPTQLNDLFLLRRISTTGQLTFAVTWTGALFVWGTDAWMNAGHGGARDINTPARVPLTAVAVTNVKTNNSIAHQTCATTLVSGDAGDDLYCWGTGYLGNGGGHESNKTPSKVLGLPVSVRDFAVGEKGHVCAVLVSGALYCWGTGDKGQLGNGVLGDRLVPTLVRP